MYKKVFILDSFALMAYFQDEAGADAVGALIKKSTAKQVLLKLSTMNWGEIYYNIARSKGLEAASQYLVLIEEFPIELVDVDRSMIMQAAIWKAQYSLSYADCFVLALAEKEGGVIVTGDPEFRRLGQKFAIHWVG